MDSTTHINGTAYYYPPALLGVTATCVFIIGIFGTFGNLLAALALLNSKKLRQRPSTYFIVNLPASLILVCAIGMPMFGAACIQQAQYGRVLLPDGIIVASYAVGYTLSQVHIHTICAIAFNRLLAVMWPDQYKKLMNTKAVTIYLIVLWIYSALLWIPLAAGAFGQRLVFVKEDLMVLMAKKYNSRLMKGMHVFFTFIVPIFFTTTCYIIMYIKVRRIRRVAEGHRRSVAMMTESHVIRQWDDHVTRTILIIYTVLITCSMPHLIIHIVKVPGKHEIPWLLLHVMFWLQFCLDPIVYVSFSRIYRRAVVDFLAKIFPRVGLFQLDDQLPRSEGRSDMKPQNLVNTPASTKYLRPPPQKIEFSSEVHRDLLDPKNLPA